MENLIEYLEMKILDANSTAEEYFQEIEDEEQGNMYLAKSAAFKEVLEYLQAQEQNELQP